MFNRLLKPESQLDVSRLVTIALGIINRSRQAVVATVVNSERFTSDSSIRCLNEHPTVRGSQLTSAVARKTQIKRIQASSTATL